MLYEPGPFGPISVLKEIEMMSYYFGGGGRKKNSLFIFYFPFIWFTINSLSIFIYRFFIPIFIAACKPYNKPYYSEVLLVPFPNGNPFSKIKIPLLSFIT